VKEREGNETYILLLLRFVVIVLIVLVIFVTPFWIILVLLTVALDFLCCVFFSLHPPFG